MLRWMRTCTHTYIHTYIHDTKIPFMYAHYKSWCWYIQTYMYMHVHTLTRWCVYIYKQLETSYSTYISQTHPYMHTCIHACAYMHTYVWNKILFQSHASALAVPRSTHLDVRRVPHLLRNAHKCVTTVHTNVSQLTSCAHARWKKTERRLLSARMCV